MKEYKLYLFDLDGTLADLDSDALYPDFVQWYKGNPAAWMIVTNQGGIGLRHWMEMEKFGDPSPYPTLESFRDRIDAMFPNMAYNEQSETVVMCARYQSKKSGQWSPLPPQEAHLNMWRQDWRKPAPGMLLYAMMLKQVHPEDTLMVGDRDEDEQAADAAGCDFMWAWKFFGRERVE